MNDSLWNWEIGRVYIYVWCCVNNWLFIWFKIVGGTLPLSYNNKESKDISIKQKKSWNNVLVAVINRFAVAD